MEKLIFLFGRRAGLSPDEFARHYLDVHAPLGLRVTRAMARYVVNLVDVDQRALATQDSPGAPNRTVDAVTEIWTPSVEEFFDPVTAFTSPEAGRELMSDHDSFIGPMHAYVVHEHVRTAQGDETHVGARSPGVKYIWLEHASDEGQREGAPARVPVLEGAGNRRAVESTVVRALTTDAPELRRVVAMQFDTLDDLRARVDAGDLPLDGPGASLLTSEYVQKW